MIIWKLDRVFKPLYPALEGIYKEVREITSGCLPMRRMLVPVLLLPAPAASLA